MNRLAAAAARPHKRGHDVAGAVAFLAPEDAAWITGATLVVDGGMSAGYGTGYLRPPEKSPRSRLDCSSDSNTIATSNDAAAERPRERGVEV